MEQDVFPDLGHVSIDEFKTYSTAPLNVEMGGCQVTICIVIIRASIGEEVAYYCMGCPTLTCHDTPLDHLGIASYTECPP